MVEAPASVCVCLLHSVFQCAWELVSVHVCVRVCVCVCVCVCLLPKRLMSLSSRAEEHLRFPRRTKKITGALLQRSILQRPVETRWAFTGDPSAPLITKPRFGLSLFNPSHTHIILSSSFSSSSPHSYTCRISQLPVLIKHNAVKKKNHRRTTAARIKV